MTLKCRYCELLFEVDENTATGFTQWCDTAICTFHAEFLEDAAVQFEDLQAWSDAPDVLECDGSELAAPLHGQTDTTEERGDLVAESEP